jgi:hypothetical protein
MDMNEYIIDMKSCAYQKFAELQKLGADAVDIGIKVQQNIYMHAMGIKKCLLVFVNKNATQDLEVILDYDPKVITYATIAIETVKAATLDALPKRDYESNDKGILPWQCAYCGFLTTCWTGVIVEFDKKNKPVCKVLAENKKSDTINNDGGK